MVRWIDNNNNNNNKKKKKKKKKNKKNKKKKKKKNKMDGWMDSYILTECSYFDAQSSSTTYNKICSSTNKTGYFRI